MRIFLAMLIFVMCAPGVFADEQVEDFRMDGFRDLRWGDMPAALGPDAVLLGTADDGSSSYIRPREKSAVFGIFTKQPSYSFGKNGFEHMSAYFVGHETLGRFLALLGRNGVSLTSCAPMLEGRQEAAIFGERRANLWFANTATIGISVEWFSTFGAITVYRNNNGK